METIYQTIVKDCGCDVGAFDKKNFLITFGHKTLVTLKDFCYFIDVTPLKKKIWAGDILKIDDQAYYNLFYGRRGMSPWKYSCKRKRISKDRKRKQN